MKESQPFPIDVTKKAASELDAAFRFYARENSRLGMAFLQTVDVALESVGRIPHAFRLVRPGVRRILLSRFPYAVYYTLKNSRIVVLGVIHLKRSDERWPAASRK